MTDKLVLHKIDCRVMIIFEDYQKEAAVDLVKEYQEKGFRIANDFSEDIPKGEQGYFELFKNEKVHTVFKK